MVDVERGQFYFGGDIDRSSADHDLVGNLLKDLVEITDPRNAAPRGIQTIEIGLQKTDIALDEMALVWVPTA